MRFNSTRLVTNDVDRLIAFYELVTGTEVTQLAPIYAELRLEGATLAICDESLVVQSNAGAAVAAANRSAIIEFVVDDVDAVHTRLGDKVDYAMPPADMGVVRVRWILFKKQAGDGLARLVGQALTDFHDGAIITLRSLSTFAFGTRERVLRATYSNVHLRLQWMEWWSAQYVARRTGCFSVPSQNFLSH
jgi:uncharacterized glyoxalase superfamily protein PhnB